MITFYNEQTQAFLDGMGRIQERQKQAQLELTTGLRINAVSDAPDEISDLLSVRSAIARNTQIGKNLASIKTETDTAESVISSAVTLVERAQSLGTQGASDMATPATRQQLADELGSVLTQLVNGANTTVGGRYIFGGDSDQTQPYTIDLTQGNPISAYAGTVATRQVELADGSSISISKTAQDIFDGSGASGNNVFMAINSLRNALIDNDSAGISSSLAQVNSSDTYINNMLSFYGTVQDRVATAIGFSSQYDTQLRTQLSTIQDADETQSIIDLNQAATQQQAALASEGQIPRTSLFNFLG
jgi:flagellar hook-associated protein 3 FlgL